MTLAIAPSASNINAALRAFLLSIIPTAGIEVILGQPNRVPEPASADFIIFTPMLGARLGTNFDKFYNVVTPPPALGSNTVAQPMQMTVQIDVHGPASGDNAQIVSTLFRDAFATDYFDANFPGISPLYAEDPRQTPFHNGEQQIEWRWSVDVYLQVDATVSGIPQAFADSLHVNVISVDETYPL